jgi:hypothetical protein
MHHSSTPLAEPPPTVIDWRVVGAALVTLALAIALLVTVLPGRLTSTAVRVTIAPTPSVNR